MGFLAKNGCLFWAISEKITPVETFWSHGFIENTDILELMSQWPWQDQAAKGVHSK